MPLARVWQRHRSTLSHAIFSRCLHLNLLRIDFSAYTLILFLAPNNLELFGAILVKEGDRHPHHASVIAWYRISERHLYRVIVVVMLISRSPNLLVPRVSDIVYVKSNAKVKTADKPILVWKFVMEYTFSPDAWASPYFTYVGETNKYGELVIAKKIVSYERQPLEDLKFEPV